MTTQDVRDLPKSEIVNRLKVFNEEYDLVHQPPEQAQVYFTQVTDAGQARPDDHYYQAQGQEPPKARTLRNICTWVMLWVFVGELVLLFWSGVI